VLRDARIVPAAPIGDEVSDPRLANGRSRIRTAPVAAVSVKCPPHDQWSGTSCHLFTDHPLWQHLAPSTCRSTFLRRVTAEARDDECSSDEQMTETASHGAVDPQRAP
jgi:hypothetical protein